MATPASIAEGLGIDGEADRDLLWLADKAHAAEAALDHYTYLATVARVPEWASPADAGQLLRNGWYRAVCAAAFEAKEPGELSVQQGEEVLVNGDLLPPAGWANVARTSDPSTAGLAPANYLVAGDVLVSSSVDFDPLAKGDLTLRRGDQMLVRPGALPARAYWFARCNGRRGYAPRYLLDPSWRAQGKIAVSLIWARYRLHRDRSNAPAAAQARAATTVSAFYRGRQARCLPRPKPLSHASSDMAGSSEDVRQRQRQRAIERRCAVALGLDLKSHRDLAWLPQLALQARPPWPDGAADGRFRALAAAALEPAWHLDGTGRLMGNGWYRATVIAPFDAQDPRELSVAADERIYVSANDLSSGGWCTAAPVGESGSRGLVPRAYLVPDDVIVTAPVAWQGFTLGDLPFSEGDQLLVRPGALPSRGYWLAMLGSRRGVVPRFVLDPSFQAQGGLAATIICARFRGHRSRNPHDRREADNLARRATVVSAFTATSQAQPSTSGPKASEPLSSGAGDPISAVRAAASVLGIELVVDPDLLWIAERALQSKPPLPDEATVEKFRALAFIASNPEWSENGAPLMRNGWYCAQMIADFDSADPAELSCSAREEIYVSGDAVAPFGWQMVARASDPSKTGLVPSSYVLSEDFFVDANCDFDGQGVGDLPFRTGDRLLVRPGALVAQGWWLAKLGSRRGYVPRYQLDPTWRTQGRLAVSIIWSRFRAHKGLSDAAEASALAALAGGWDRSQLPAAERRCSAALGINLSIDGDLLWLAQRALSSKPRWPDAKTHSRFAELATVAMTPPWPVSTPETRLLQDGSYEATAIASFLTGEAGEMSVAVGERVLVRGLPPAAPAGWVVAAREADHADVGLVPHAYLAVPDVAVQAIADYDGVSNGDLSFKSGDVLAVRPSALGAQGWWLAKIGQHRGYVPRYVLDPLWRPWGRLAVATIWAGYCAHRGRRSGDTPSLADAKSRTILAQTEALLRPAGGAHETIAAETEQAAVAPSELELCAMELGIDEQLDGDLMWIAQAALQAKPPVGPWPSLAAMELYGSLAAVAIEPDWPANPRTVRPGMPDGWYRAIAVSSFNAEDDRELMIEQDEALYVSGDDETPPGWVFAMRTNGATDEGGLVPRSYLAAEDVSVVAPCDFEGVSPGDLPFRKGDVLLVRPGVLPAAGFWLAKLGARRGYVPRFLLDPSWVAKGRRAVRVIRSRLTGAVEDVGVQASDAAAKIQRWMRARPTRNSETPEPPCSDEEAARRIQGCLRRTSRRRGHARAQLRRTDAAAVKIQRRLRASPTLRRPLAAEAPTSATGPVLLLVPSISAPAPAPVQAPSRATSEAEARPTQAPGPEPITAGLEPPCSAAPATDLHVVAASASPNGHPHLGTQDLSWLSAPDLEEIRAVHEQAAALAMREAKLATREMLQELREKYREKEWQLAAREAELEAREAASPELSHRPPPAAFAAHRSAPAPPTTGAPVIEASCVPEPQVQSPEPQVQSAEAPNDASTEPAAAVLGVPSTPVARAGRAEDTPTSPTRAKAGPPPCESALEEDGDPLPSMMTWGIPREPPAPLAASQKTPPAAFTAPRDAMPISTASRGRNEPARRASSQAVVLSRGRKPRPRKKASPARRSPQYGTSKAANLDWADERWQKRFQSYLPDRSAAGFSDATALPAAGKSAIMGGSKRGATATRTAIVRDAATGLLTGL